MARAVSRKTSPKRVTRKSAPKRAPKRVTRKTAPKRVMRRRSPKMHGMNDATNPPAKKKSSVSLFKEAWNKFW
jgi:hypothetical protein